MTLEAFAKHILQNHTCETIYTDSNGREILVIRMLDAYRLVHDFKKVQVTAWGCTREELETIAAKVLDDTFNTEKKNEPTSR